MRVEYTSNAFHHSDFDLLVSEANAFCEEVGWEFGIQIHNTGSITEIERFKACGLPISFHAPIASSHYLNLAASNIDNPLKSLEVTVGLMRKYGVKLAVFHGFLMTDNDIPAFTRYEKTGAGYNETVGKAYRAELSRDGTDICGDFLNTAEYQERLARVANNIRRIKEMYPDLVICIENDFPKFSSGLLLAEAMEQIPGPLCLDTSHLWAACCLFKHNFLTEVERIVKTGRVKCVHLHASELEPDAAIRDYKDGHQPLSTKTPFELNLKEATKIMLAGNIEHFVLEIPAASRMDLEILQSWCQY